MAEMVDVAPELWRDISRIFRTEMQTDRTLARLMKRIESGKATYEDAQKIAIRIGEHSGKSLESVLTVERLPDGHLYWNIAEKTILPKLRQDYSLIAEATEEIQTGLNQAAGIGLKAVVPGFNEERCKSLLDRIVSEDTIDTVKWALRDPVTRLAQSVVDDFVRENASAQSRAGMRPQIIRTAEPGACAWCQELAGTYDYADVRDRGNEVYMRHNNCKCTVTYVPRAGTYSMMSRSGNAFQRW